MSDKKKKMKGRKILKKVRDNPFIVATAVLGIIVIFFVLNGFCLTGNSVSKNEAGEGLIDYLSSAGYTGFEVTNVEEMGGIYKINTIYQDSEIPFYVTKDGYIVGNKLISIIPEKPKDAPKGTDVPKSEIPSAGLYIWSYCPYGVTALSPFADVASLLEDSADFKVYLYYAGHGDFEVQQNKIQACIQELGYEQYWNYAKTFADEIYDKCYGDVACDLTESTALMDSLGINSAEVLTCVNNQGDALLEEHYNAAKEVGVTGSPSLVVNGVKVSSSRTAEAYKQAVCSAYDNEPSECDTELSGTSATTSGSC